MNEQHWFRTSKKELQTGKIRMSPYITQDDIDRWNSVILEITFRVGDPDVIVGDETISFPADGDSFFILKDCDGSPIIDRQVKLFREYEKMEPDDHEFGFHYNPANGFVTVAPILNFKERMHFFIYRLGTFDGCENEVDVDFLMINESDHLLINMVDKFIL